MLVRHLPALPVMISVEVIFEVELLGGAQREAFLAPALAGLGVRQHQQTAALPRRPKRRHHSVTWSATWKPVSSAGNKTLPINPPCCETGAELIPREVLSCTARCRVPARKLTSSGRKRFEKETYSSARQQSTKPDVTSCNDLTGHWGHTRHGKTHTNTVDPRKHQSNFKQLLRPGKHLQSSKCLDCIHVEPIFKQKER